MANPRLFAGAPGAVVLTNEAGSISAEAALKPPVSGTDAGFQVHTGGGAANLATGQLTATTTAASLAAARPTRRTIAVTNHDASINLFVGNAGVLATTGFVVKPGATATLAFTGAVFAVAASATLLCSFAEAYD